MFLSVEVTIILRQERVASCLNTAKFLRFVYYILFFEFWVHDVHYEKIDLIPA